MENRAKGEVVVRMVMARKVEDLLLVRSWLHLRCRRFLDRLRLLNHLWRNGDRWTLELTHVAVLLMVLVVRLWELISAFYVVKKDTLLATALTVVTVALSPHKSVLSVRSPSIQPTRVIVL